MEIKSLGIEGPNQSVQIDRFENPISKSGSQPSGANPQGPGFGELLENMIQETNVHQVQADHAIKELVAGRTKNIHETLLTVEKADTSLKLMMQVRNKVLEAYREIMRMQV